MIDSAPPDQKQTNQYLFKEPEQVSFSVLLLFSLGSYLTNLALIKFKQLHVEHVSCSPLLLQLEF